MLKEKLAFAIQAQLDPHSTITNDAREVAALCMEVFIEWMEEQKHPNWVVSSIKRERI